MGAMSAECGSSAHRHRLVHLNWGSQAPIDPIIDRVKIDQLGSRHGACCIQNWEVASVYQGAPKAHNALENACDGDDPTTAFDFEFACFSPLLTVSVRCCPTSNAQSRGHSLHMDGGMIPLVNRSIRSKSTTGRGPHTAPCMHTGKRGKGGPCHACMTMTEKSTPTKAHTIEQLIMLNAHSHK